MNLRASYNRFLNAHTAAPASNGAKRKNDAEKQTTKILGVNTMISSNRIKGGVFAVLVIVLFAGMPAGADPNEIAKIVPADSLLCIQINNLDTTLSQTDQYLGGILPPMMGTQMMLRMGLAQMLGNPSLDGVNTGGSLAVFISAANGETDKEMFTIVIPVADYQKLVASSPNIDKADAYGISAIKGVGGFAAQVGGFLFVKPPDSYKSLLAMKKSIAGPGFKSLASSLDSATAAQSASSPLWIYGNMPAVQKNFGPQVAAALEEMKKMKNMPAQMPPGAMASPESAKEMMAIMSDIASGFMEQSKSVILTIKPQPDCLTISTTVSALPGTKMAGLFVPNTAKKENKLIPYLQNGAMINVSGGMNGKTHAAVTKLFTDWFSKKATPEKAAKILALENEAVAVFNGNIAFSGSVDPNGKPPMSAIYIYEISDKDKLNKIIDEAVELVNSGLVDDIYKAIGMPIQFRVTFKRGAATYNGVSIDSAIATTKFTDANSPEAQMVKQMYGGNGIEYRLAVVNNLLVFALGGDSDAKLKILIDQVKAGGPTQVCSEVKNAMAILPGSEKADSIATFNYIKCFDFMSGMTPMMPKMNIPTKSNLAIAGRIDNGSVTVDIAIPKEHLMELVQAFQILMQASMQPPQPNMLEPAKPADANSKK